tara:strand:- start:600 stop:866 length:267 start_codon:yes stop_codon:yes gene_type:complete
MKKICAECGEELKGCACGWAKTSDGKLVHKKCKKSYEAKLGKPTDPQKVVCAHCGGEFDGKPYFKAMDGKFVHFRCQRPYENQLYKNN